MKEESEMQPEQSVVVFVIIDAEEASVPGFTARINYSIHAVFRRIDAFLANISSIAVCSPHIEAE